MSPAVYGLFSFQLTFLQLGRTQPALSLLRVPSHTHMPDFNKNSRFGGSRRPFNNSGPQGRSFGPRRDFGAPEMHDAECNNCGARCQVPFRPNGKKPIYCKDCFVKDDSREDRPRFASRDAAPARMPAAAAHDPRIDALARQMGDVQATLERIAGAVESLGRAQALSAQVRKVLPTAKPAAAPKKAVAKKPVKKAAKKA